jgi:flagellar hook-basal body complex protein FliE
MKMDELQRIRAILQMPEQPRPDQTPGPDQVSFQETLKTFIQDVDHLQKNSDELTQRLVAGDAESIHQVMLAMEEANTSFRLMMEMRNKILDAYREVMRMQI